MYEFGGLAHDFQPIQSSMLGVLAGVRLGSGSPLRSEGGHPMNPVVAVVGMACRYPEADNPAELWENVLTQRRSFRRMPPGRLSLDDYYSADPSTPDAIYAEHVAVLEDYVFDRVRFRISGGTYRSADLTHWLALDVADAVLADAGFGERLTADRSRVAVIMGNTLTGEFSRASVLRLRWPYVRRQVADALSRHGWAERERADFLTELERDFKAPFPETGEETLSGSLSNTIAGRICNTFDFGGGGYTVDGACSSSLLAVTTACEALLRGDVDLALAGGVDLSLDAFELIGFAKTKALATDLMRVYDERSAGFWPGEGCGMVALARYEDAVEQGARVYATIRGWGVSSDGRGGITRPERRGQMLALDRAYERAGYPISSVALFEGHGTGTAVGDATELGALSDACRAAGGQDAPAAIGSIKANIGHTKAAAGVAGMIKAILAVDRQILPPTTGCERPQSALLRPDAALRVLPGAEPWPAGRPLRASVSAMGFGGINTHIAIEGVAAAGGRRLTSREGLLSASAQDIEVFPFAGDDRAALAERVAGLAAAARGLSFGQLRDLAVELATEVEPDRSVRAAVLAATPAQLTERLGRLAEVLRGETEPDGSTVLFGAGTARPRIGFLFSGQGSPTYLDGGALARRFSAAAAVLAAARLEGGPDLRDTAVAQPAVVTSSLAGAAVLEQCGVVAEVAVGHSLGELTALRWAGALDDASLLELARARGRAMADCPGEKGIMVDLATDPGTAGQLIGSLPVTIAAFNGPERTVVAGTAGAVGQVVARARDRGTRATPLRVSHAFHSPLVEPAAHALREWLKDFTFGPLRRPVVSTVTGTVLDAETDLDELLVRQVTSPVRFIDALAAAGPLDLVIEVGPGQALAGLAGDCGVPAVATDAAGPALAPLLRAVAAAFVAGAPVRFGLLAIGRSSGRRPALEPRTFLANPCEQAPAGEPVAPGRPVAAVAPVADPPAQPAKEAGRSPVDLLRGLVAARAELPLEAVPASGRLLTDLHLNSITVAQIAAEAAGVLGVRPLLDPTEFADASIGELADVLAAAEPDDPAADVVSGVADWVRAFETIAVPAPRAAVPPVPTRWQVMVDEADRWAEAARSVFGPDGEEAAAARGVVVVLGERRSLPAAHRLLAAAQAGLEQADRFAVVHRGGAAGLVKTLFLERPALAVRVLELAGAGDLPAARAEAETGRGFAEVRLAGGRRTVPQLRPITPGAGESFLSGSDVLVVSGGGKGIGALCGRTLAAASGARLALLGRSPVDDPEVAETVRAASAAGVQVRYLIADVADAQSVRAAMGRVRAELGEPTALLHAAGVNEPARLGQLTPAELDRTVRPKSTGLDHLVAATDPQSLRLLLAFGSIIGTGGMPGEAHYALANDWLRHDVEEIAERLPQVRCRVVDWSVWSGVGMGEKLGLLQSMLRRGVSPISVDEGAAWCRRLVDASDAPTAVVVTGRYGQLPTLPMAGDDALPLHRFLDTPLVWYPGVELVVETRLSTAADPYLLDHCLAGVPLVPAVLGLEAMAQVAGALTGRPVTGFTGIDLPRPISVPADGERVVRIAALVEGDEVHLAIRSAETSFAVDHFRARCRFGEPDGDVFAEALEAGPPIGAGALPEGLYGRQLFHGPRFQRVLGYRELRARRAVTEIAVDDEAPWFGQYLSPTLLLGDFGARDAFLHAAQACVPHRRVLPVAIGRIDLLRRPGTGVARTVAVERWSDPTTLCFDLAVFGADGALCEVWRELTLRTVEELAPPASWPAALAVPYLERRLGELGLPGIGLALAGTGSGEHRSGPAFAQLLGPEVPVRYRSDGRPEVAGGHVSAAHGGGLTLALRSAGVVAGDLEPVTAREPSTWQAMLGADRYALAEQLLRHGVSSIDEAATRVWSAAECLRKAGTVGAHPILLEGDRQDDGWVLLRAGRWRIATARISVAGSAHPLITAVLTGLDL